jgi:RNA polymerase sigma-70 factor (ECF subfamily)
MTRGGAAAYAVGMLQHTSLDTLDLCAVQHRKQFLATARRVLGDPTAAQDAVQDAMLSAARNLHRFRGDSQLSTWLGRIVINAALTRRRALRRRREESLDTLLEREAAGESRKRRTLFASAAPSQERMLLRKEVTSMLRAAVDGLPNDYRTVVLMRHYKEHRVAEIATHLRITPNAVKLRLLRAHRVLRTRLMERGCVVTSR